MTESISLTTSAKKISALVATGGAYIVSLASRLVGNVAENAIDELSWVNGALLTLCLAPESCHFRAHFSQCGR